MVITICSNFVTPGTREYCQWETFNATCRPDEVIIMKTADYGRMRLGRCLLRDYGYVGCKDDVLKYVDSKCSGRHKCTFKVPDPVLDMVQPCPGDLKSYMQASYACLKGKSLFSGTMSLVIDSHVWCSRSE